MNSQKLHEIWIEQYHAAEDIKQRYGLQAAFDYLVAEKLQSFANAAASRPEFARELPRFVSRVRLMFTQTEIRTHIARVERELRESNVAVPEDDALIQDSPATIAERARQFASIKELLTAPALGTS